MKFTSYPPLFDRFMRGIKKLSFCLRKFFVCFEMKKLNKKDRKLQKRLEKQEKKRKKRKKKKKEQTPPPEPVNISDKGAIRI